MDSSDHAGILGLIAPPDDAPAAADSELVRNGPADAAQGAAPEAVRTPVLALDFGVHVSLRYHAKRRAWFDGLHRLAAVIAGLGASAAVGAVFGGLDDAAADLMVVVAIAAALELVFALSARARAADALHRRFGALAGEIAASRSIDSERLRDWERRRLLIRADAEERLLMLHRICYNLEAEARGYSTDALYDVKPWQRLFAHLVSLPPYRPLRLWP